MHYVLLVSILKREMSHQLKKHSNERNSNDPGQGLLSKNTEHIEFVNELIRNASESEKLNFRAYLRALEDGLLENHRGRFVFISKGKMLNKSFKRAHDVYDHVALVSETIPSPHATFVYVPI